MTVLGMNQEIVNDLKALVKKHNLGVHESEKYGGEDEMYCGSDFYFVVGENIVSHKNHW